MKQFTAPAVSISLPPGFTFSESAHFQEGAVPNVNGKSASNGTNGHTTKGTNGHNGVADLKPPVSTLETPDLEVLRHFKGTFKGLGFNTIFRPNNTKAGISELQVPPQGNDAGVTDNILQLNLTAETQVFSTPLSSDGNGAVPNRGLDDQQDIGLDGISYVQTIIDLTEVKPNTRQPVIHFEPGLWMRVPPTEDPALPASYARMGSIPHGTTINAQCFEEAITTDGPPKFPSADINPFLIGDNQKENPIIFGSQDAGNNATHRLPQDLTLFLDNKSITADMIKDPNTVLSEVNKNKTITKSTTFTVSTDSSPGGGTSNIGFLVDGKGTQNGPPKNANAVSMTATYWVSTVRAEVELRPGQGGTVSPAAHGLRDGVPTFVVDEEITTARTVTVEYTQIQYSQTVMLNFARLTWPHVTVATLAPTDISLKDAIVR
ncbi:hypothetical protein CGCF415_v006477 [Colletotrichum fructicola]|uniref:Uncharacterized protein n=1 Tax=Colletotrichum fructicola (strain Nara gc5) TaxID=1213859 RepID=L2FSJ7_COLFN|nr:uncharacterized protein CGMCC3_g9897 [Colletotrichum fructicola]KAF4481787.1 hypothetical protein CGGC5_v009049 [Colletotrichum fructicola Nara gc5]KAI8279481.1 hypothetical protein K4K60_005572 [Colletotrichum sp. SAR11_57]KAE9574091.1 hypothetical protein CGMCC3_g9897 [Colletotrichum fructicola]KAF4430608.1 hypothetical protein CFRS1_v009566 [Colletotrichum fructicola]KAF4884867.1 hypothetical protein CGCFRS4_v012365 [Colletotrichum fructicola]